MQGASAPIECKSGCAIRMSGVGDRHRVAIRARWEPPVDRSATGIRRNVECPHFSPSDPHRLLLGGDLILDLPIGRLRNDFLLHQLILPLKGPIDNDFGEVGSADPWQGFELVGGGGVQIEGLSLVLSKSHQCRQKDEQLSSWEPTRQKPPSLYWRRHRPSAALSASPLASFTSLRESTRILKSQSGSKQAAGMVTGGSSITASAAMGGVGISSEPPGINSMVVIEAGALLCPPLRTETRNRGMLASGMRSQNPSGPASVVRFTGIRSGPS